MTQEHPITPPAELVQQWVDNLAPKGMLSFATQAARWGSDQELEACLNQIYKGVGLCLIPYGSHRELLCSYLRAARRPKPPSLKEQALEALEALPKFAIQENTDFICIIRRALEQLDD